MNTSRLCPALKYKCECQIGGRCNDCPNFYTNKGENCKGCVVNLKKK